MAAEWYRMALKDGEPTEKVLTVAATINGRSQAFTSYVGHIAPDPDGWPNTASGTLAAVLAAVGVSAYAYCNRGWDSGWEQIDTWGWHIASNEERSWDVEFPVESEYPLGPFPPGTIISEGSKRIEIEVRGDIHRYGMLDYPAVSSNLAVNEVQMTHGGIIPEPLSHCQLYVKDVVNTWHVTIKLDGEILSDPSGQFDVECGAGADGDTSESISVDMRCLGTLWNSPGFEAVTDGVYTRSPNNVCSQSRAYTQSYPLDDIVLGSTWIVGVEGQESGEGSMWGHWEDSVGSTAGEVSFQMGNGTFSIAGGLAMGYWPTAGPSGYNAQFGCSFVDSIGPYPISYAQDIKNMDEVDRSPVDLQTHERHSAFTDTPFEECDPVIGPWTPPSGFRYNYYNSLVEWPYGAELLMTTECSIAYTGKIDFHPQPTMGGSLWGYLYGGYEPDEHYEDVGPWAGEYLAHGDLSMPGVLDGTLKEPAWAAFPSAGLEHYDNIPLVAGDERLDHEEALTLTLHAPGLVATPLVFTNAAITWADTACTSSVVSGKRHVVVAAGITNAKIEDTATLDTNIRMTGTRFAKVCWQASVNGAIAVLHLGKHSWNLTAVGTGPQTTLIDLCKPDATTGGDGLQQSLIEKELPLDRSGAGGVRLADASYDWEMDAGWGVGRVKSVKIDCPTPDCTYDFESVYLYRKTALEGGFAKFYVVPPSGPWNDSCEMTDFAWHDSGEIYVDSERVDKVSAIRKGFLVIDGAVVWELMAGYVVEVNDDLYIDPSHTANPYYDYHYWRLSRFAGLGLGYPLDDYTLTDGDPDATKYDVNGAVTITPGTFGTDLVGEHCLIAFLRGGVYEPVDDVITVGLSIMPRYFNIVPGCGLLPTGSYKRFRGQVYGVAWKEDGGVFVPDASGVVTEDLRGGSAGEDGGLPVYADDLGDFIFEAVNTKGQAAITSLYPSGPTCVDLRSRFYTRVARLNSNCTEGLHLRYCSTTGKIVITPSGKPALTCCDEA